MILSSRYRVKLFKILNALVGPEIIAKSVRYVENVNEIVIRQRPPIERIWYEVK